MKNNISSMINSTDNLIWSVDEPMNFTTANRATIETFSIGDPTIPAHIRQERAKLWKGDIQRGLNGESVSATHERHDPKTAEKRFTHISFNPIIDDLGNVNDVSCYAADITEQEIKEQALNRQTKNSRKLPGYKDMRYGLPLPI